MSSNWDRKATLDKMFMHVPPHQRRQYLERLEAQKKAMQTNEGKDTASVSAPKNPFLKKKGTATGQAKKAGEPEKGDSKKSAKTTEMYGGLSEALTSQLGMVAPRPMFVGTVPGSEVRDDQSYSVMTAEGGEDGHKHKASYDEAGNGATLPDETGHIHSIRSFQVDDYQHPDGTMWHGHPGTLEKPERTPGSEYKDYDGVM